MKKEGILSAKKTRIFSRTLVVKIPLALVPSGAASASFQNPEFERKFGYQKLKRSKGKLMC